MLFFVISVLTLNIILWVVLLIKFKNLFSTDKIIETTREKVNRIIKDVDNATDRNTYLTKEMQKRLENALQEAEERMELFKEATQRLRDMIAEADRINHGKVPAAAAAIKEEKPAKKDIPLVITKVYDDKAVKKNVEVVPDDKTYIIQKKLDQGLTPEEIAANLNCSITEVQFIIDMS